MSGFTRTITETFGGSTEASVSAPADISSKVEYGVTLSRANWDRAIGALSLAVSIGGLLYLKNSFTKWRARVNQEYQRKEQARLLRKRNAVAADVFHAARYPTDACVELDLHRANCHCGRIKITIRAPIHLRAVDCSTAMSTKKGRFPYIFVDSDDFRLDCGGDFLTVYTSGTHTAKHMFCSACGVHVFAFPRGTADAGGISVNVHTIDRATVESLHVSFVPGDHLMHDEEPTVPTIPNSPTTRRARIETMHPTSTLTPSSNPQASSPVMSPSNSQQQQQQQQQQQEKQQQQIKQTFAYQPYRAQPTLTELLAPGLPVPMNIYGVVGGELPIATQVPNAGQGLAGVNFFRKTRHVQHSTPRSNVREPTIMQTLVHGGGAAAYAIGNALGALSPENQNINASNMTTPYRSNATTFNSSNPSSLSSSSSSRRASSERRRTYQTRTISPIRAMIDGHDPLYNTRVRNTEVKKMESMNSVISIKHQLQRYLGQHKTPTRDGRRTDSGYYE